MERPLKTLYKALDELLDKYKRDCTPDELQAFLEASITSQKDLEVLRLFLNQIKQAVVGNDVLHDLLAGIKKKYIATELANASFDFIEGRSSLDNIKQIYEKFDDIEEELEEIEFVTDDLETLYEETVKNPGLRWRLNSLNQMLGSLRPGDFGFIFARPETGKTTFLASEATYFASQTNRPILWFNNEEQGNKVMIRCYQATLGLKLHELMRNRNEHKQRYLETTKGNLRIFDSANIYKRQVEDFCQRFKPALVIFDQIDKIKGFDGDREDLRLGIIYQWARELAKTYCPVIGVCQADGTGEGQKWLTMNNVANAKTAKQAEADFIIGIGKQHDPNYEYIRHINISKNKLSGDVDTIPELRHGRCDILIEPEIARYKDVG